MEPILRCGPWGHVGGGDTRPFESVGAEDSYPVNCAKTNWDTLGAWSCLWVRSTQPNSGFPTTGSISLGGSVAVTRATAFIIFNFCYQADQSFTITLDWTISSPVTPARTLVYNTYTIEGSDVEQTISIGNSGIQNITCSASVLGRFRARFDAITPDVRPRREATIIASLS